MECSVVDGHGVSNNATFIDPTFPLKMELTDSSPAQAVCTV